MKNEKNAVVSIFEELSSINVNGHTEKKRTGSTELTYLSWPWAWAEVKKRYPDATYTIYRDEENRPYIEDEDFGLMCYTTVTIGGLTHGMWRPVMNGANKSMKRCAYKYKVYNAYKRTEEEKVVEAATMFDINKTIMRCLVKNLAMFGLGLYIYAGEDLPDTNDGQPRDAAKKEVTQTDEADMKEAFETIADNIRHAGSRDELRMIIDNNKQLHQYKPFMDAVNQRWREVQ